MTVRSSDLRRRAADARPERTILTRIERDDGWTLTLEKHIGGGLPPSLVIRTFAAKNERGSQVRILATEIPALEGACRMVDSRNGETS